ncbi:DUF4129 domain-containing protein [Microbacterium ulmi]|uniref:DUF4129 domain-containing protein n=1 Tax=Microbacterium ulmi TaxID=179095 RepID=A0A7Y2M382_9MICO|nr:hypothetical protein [Microbacterium ulmi]NNH05482.1 DUF4129 domain-containing protein [Microbacterium ulmi]
MGLAVGALLVAIPGPPLAPEGDDARRWAEQELSDPAYAAAQPTAFDRIARAIGDFVADLLSAQLPEGVGSLVALVAAAVAIGVIATAILVWGVPRATARSRRVPAELFGEAETRSATQLRADAASRASEGEWEAAIVLRFRALARGLSERGIVDPPPGATVHAFARRAGRSFPASAAELEAAAGAFDDVRYLRRPGTAELYRCVAAVDDAVAAARPVVHDPAGVPA